MTQQTDPQEVLARLAERVEGLRRECPCIRIPGDGRPEDGYDCFNCWRANQHVPWACNCKNLGYVPLPLLDAVAWLLDNKVVVSLDVTNKGRWLAGAGSGDKGQWEEALDPDWRTAVLLSAEKALEE